MGRSEAIKTRFAAQLAERYQEAALAMFSG